MDIINSLYISVFGISVVFIALVFLIVFITVQSSIIKRLTARKAAAKAAVIPADPPAPARSADTSKLVLTNTEERTAALIMAIICEESGIMPNELYFKSIRLLEE